MLRICCYEWRVEWLIFNNLLNTYLLCNIAMDLKWNLFLLSETNIYR